MINQSAGAYSLNRSCHRIGVRAGCGQGRRGNHLRTSTSGTRSTVDKNLPTIAEAGFVGFDADIWFGFLAPAGTPRDIVTKLNGALNKIMSMPEVQRTMADNLFSYCTSTPEEFANIIQSDLAKWSKLVNEAHIKGD